MATKKDENKEEPVSIDAQVKEIKEGLNALWAIVRPLKDFLKSMYPDVIDKGGKTAALLLMLGLTAVCAFAVSPLADTNAVLQYEDPDAPTNKLFTLDRQGNLNIDGSLAASGGAGLYRDVYVSGVATAENLRVWGASAVNSLTATGAVVLSGTVNLKDGSVTNEDLAADAVTGTKVADGTISNPCLTTKSIDATKLTGTAGRMIIADAGATGQWKAISGPVLIGQDGKSDVINSAITNENLAADAVTSAKIAQNTIVGSDLATNAVGEEQIATAVRSTNLFANLLWDVSLSSAESASPSNATITIQCRNPWGT
ncbi:MAG: hypothetical protein KKD77_21655, partial [Gammaproteobacteria bacterium]|nr:hypothetical protein [Gammaproteobacteria bacterium]